MKLKKRKRSKRMHGKGMGTHGWGARKKHKGSGHRGGFGMAGTGKRADQKKTLVIKLYDNKYFGKQGFTSRSTRRRKNPIINLAFIEKNIDSLRKKYEKNGVLNLAEYKILGDGEIKNKLELIVHSISKSARAKIEKAGGKVTEKNNKEEKKKI